MTAERWKVVEDLVYAAWELPEDSRAAFLSVACAHDAALLREVGALVDARRQSDDWQPPPPPPQQTESASSTRQFGPYRLEKMIGRGGMGAVYLAHRADGEYHHKVAIKIVGLPFEIGPLRERFKQERQILANLNHPNITHLLDGGVTEDGELYLAMEYVDGLPLDEHLRVHRLTVEAKLALFQQIAHAVAYAHQNLIVHRDLKPSNIVVTAQGVPKLLDFGTAKLLHSSDPASPTGSNTGFLTVGYASPEQLRGKSVTTLSDVYSLSAILYEMLSGEKAFSPVLAERVESASDLRLPAKLPGELDLIVRKGLAPDPALRYSSVEQLAEDLRRYQDGEPLLAHRPSWSYHARKFVLRHRLAVAATTLAGVSLLAAGLFAARQAALARLEARRATAVSEFMDKTLSSASPFSGGKQNRTVKDVLDEASANAAAEFSGAPAIEAQIRLTVASAYYDMDQVSKAIGELERGISRAREAGDVRLLARLHLLMGSALQYSPQASQAEWHKRQAVAYLEQLKGADPILEFRVLADIGYFLRERPAGEEAERYLLRAIELARTVPGISEAQLASTLGTLGRFYSFRNQRDRAEPLLSEALHRFRRMKRMPLESLSVLDAAAGHAVATGDQAKVVALRKEVLDLYRRELGPANSSTITALAKWARAESNFGHLDLALREMDTGIAQLYATYPKLVFGNWNAVTTYAELLGKAKRFHEAERFAREAIACLPPEKLGTLYEGQSLFALGRALRGQGRQREAIAVLEKSLALYVRLMGDTKQTTGVVRRELEEARRPGASSRP